MKCTNLSYEGDGRVRVRREVAGEGRGALLFYSEKGKRKATVRVGVVVTTKTTDGTHGELAAPKHEGHEHPTSNALGRGVRGTTMTEKKENNSDAGTMHATLGLSDEATRV